MFVKVATRLHYDAFQNDRLLDLEYNFWTGYVWSNDSGLSSKRTAYRQSLFSYISGGEVYKHFLDGSCLIPLEHPKWHIFSVCAKSANISSESALYRNLSRFLGEFHQLYLSIEIVEIDCYILCSLHDIHFWNGERIAVVFISLFEILLAKEVKYFIFF